MDRPILLITGCQKYRSYLEAAIRRMTSDKWEIVGIVGGGESIHFNSQTRILTLTSKDTYETLPSKLQAAYCWIFNNYPNVPGLFKTDDDIIFSIPHLESEISKNQHKPYWGLVTHQCQEAEINSWRIGARFDDKTLKPKHQTATYCYGIGYWLNRQALKIISESEQDYQTSCLEDVCTGYVLNKHKIFPEKIIVPAQEIMRTPELLNLIPKK